MHTSCFSRYKGPGRISIARSAPRGDSGFKVYRALAPGSWFHSVSEAEYRKLYWAEILAKLDPQQTWDDLHVLADGATPVLLCWEKLMTPDDWCHRTMVAEWFAETLGLVVTEWTPEDKNKKKPDSQPTLF